ncbi:50S ribosomal protein L17 [Candidatus Daviesbacteria bacterium]|nr:50S ribosomal protein L17 [Candidatus Daviesbacteria bacterium]
MRHRVYGKHLGRNKDQRKLLFKGLMYSLFSYGTIQTSEAKAKAIKGLVDKVINLAKAKNTAELNSFIFDENLQKRVNDEIVPKLGTRVSGYTRLVKTGTRSGDQTAMVRMSLIGSEELKPLEKGSRVQGLGVSKKTVASEADKKEKKTIKAVKKTVRVKSKSSKTK